MLARGGIARVHTPGHCVTQKILFWWATPVLTYLRRCQSVAIISWISPYSHVKNRSNFLPALLVMKFPWYPLLSDTRRSVQYASKISRSQLWWANSAEVLYFKNNLGHPLSLLGVDYCCIPWLLSVSTRTIQSDLMKERRSREFSSSSDVCRLHIFLMWAEHCVR